MNNSNNYLAYLFFSVFCCFFLIFVIGMAIQYFFAFDALSRGDYGAAYSIMAPRPSYSRTYTSTGPLFTF